MINKFGCTKNHRCDNCVQKKNCTVDAAKNYRQYRRKLKEEHSQSYRCEEIGGLCRLKKCKRYGYCNKVAKRKYEKWQNAYNLNLKHELEKMSRGGV